MDRKVPSGYCIIFYIETQENSASARGYKMLLPESRRARHPRVAQGSLSSLAAFPPGSLSFRRDRKNLDNSAATRKKLHPIKSRTPSRAAGPESGPCATNVTAAASGLFPSYCLAHAPHPSQLIFRHWTQPLSFERLVHSLLIGGAGHAHIHLRAAQDVAVAICGGGDALVLGIGRAPENRAGILELPESCPQLVAVNETKPGRL